LFFFTGLNTDQGKIYTYFCSSPRPYSNIS